MIALHLVLVVLSRRSQEWRIVVWVRRWKAKHHVIHGWTIVMVLMMLMVVHVANMHVVAHGASRMQREWLGIVIREARNIWSIASEHVLLVLLLLVAVRVLLVALVANSVIFLDFFVGF